MRRRNPITERGVEELGGSAGVVVNPELNGVCKSMARK